MADFLLLLKVFHRVLKDTGMSFTNRVRLVYNTYTSLYCENS